MGKPMQWTRFATRLQGSKFGLFQRELTRFNHERLVPLPNDTDNQDRIRAEYRVAIAESRFIEAVRERIKPLTTTIPVRANSFVEWFENLRAQGPGQGDPLFPWLEQYASREQMRWFIEQEVAGEAGFEDLVALTQIKMPVRAKLEMGRNYWDELGRGVASGMHGPMLGQLAKYFAVDSSPERVVPESLALGNMMLALARSRSYAFHSVGALGVIELTAPDRAAYVDRALRRLRVSAKTRMYFALHAVLDVKHSAAWNREVIGSLIEEDPCRAQAIGEGALIRLWHGARCFEQYRARLFAEDPSVPHRFAA